MMKKIWMITLLLCLGSCSDAKEGEDFGPYPTKAEVEKDQ